MVRRNGIELAAFENLPDGGEFRKRQGIPAGERIVLYLGRISPIKNLEQLVAAFAQADLKNVRLVLAGPMLEADYAARLQAQAAALRPADKIIFTGPLFGADKLAALAAADLFVLPSLSESFGNAAAEAVAARVPVLLTDTCGIAAMIHGRAGLAVPLGVGSLAAGLRTMLDCAPEAATLTGRQEEVRRELSWEEPISQTEAMYQEILAGGKAES
ncbi:MAG: glycosyltransferase [Verrucomicrobia bacterium]|nr:glycosyltransferase [Verrucomicrobiota bacterium]